MIASQQSQRRRKKMAPSKKTKTTANAKAAPKSKAKASTPKAAKTPPKEIRVRRAIDEKISDEPYEAASPLQAYLNQICKDKLLTREEEVELAKQIKAGSQEARNKMVQANLRLVVKIANEYSNFGLPLLDLIGEGNLGLIKAVERFDPEKGGKLSTYASWWIKQAIKRSLANNAKTIRLPVHLVDKISQMRKITMRLADQLEREPTDEEIAHEMSIPVRKVSHYKSVSTRPASLDAPIGDGDNSQFGDLIGDENAQDPFELMTESGMKGDLKRILSQLEPREAQIISMRFGLKGDKPLTLEEVGAHFDITRERIRQLQTLAIKKIRRMLEETQRQRSSEEIEAEKHKQTRQEILKSLVKK